MSIVSNMVSTESMLPLDEGDSIPSTTLNIFTNLMNPTSKTSSNLSKSTSYSTQASTTTNPKTSTGADSTRLVGQKKIGLRFIETFDADPIIKNRPIRLTSKDGHAMTIINADAPYPDTVEGGVIIRAKNGNPIGIFHDEVQLFIQTTTSDEVLEQRFFFTVEDSLKNSITVMHNAGLVLDTLEFYKSDCGYSTCYGRYVVQRTTSHITVEGINPLEGFCAAITRVNKEGRSSHGPGG
ncbi:hypothetical protein K435DRAFT_844574 [Dendrothele bispora CBS 962.96]|uniref:Uncharacterized protein n=1 Tax=Dendrothele bispora (strain CBS 962.96) TaxID=1314807 RepID=A0A4S8L0K2_DENBC|nr:hypothetical protein K435DRAFT_844574 [Dendrothele bispora CBS 962.96]